MPTPAPHAHQVPVREVSSGHVVMAWPVDAREMIRGGGYTLEPVEAAPVVEVVKDETPMEARMTARATLDERSHKDLQALAKSAGINAGQKRSELIDALVPLVVGRVVSLDVLPPIGPVTVGQPLVIDA